MDDIKPKEIFGAFIIILFCIFLFAYPALKPDVTWYSIDGPLAFSPWKNTIKFKGRRPRNPDLGDEDFLYYPFLCFMAREIKNRGEIPLWNPHVYAGVPLAGNAQFPIFYPIHGILWASQIGKKKFDEKSFQRSFLWHAVLRLILVCFGGWLWLKRCGLRFFSSLFGAFILGFGGYNILWLQYTPSQVFSLVPFALFFLESFLKSGKRFNLIFFGLFFASSNLGGYPQTSFFIGGFIFVYAIFRIKNIKKDFFPFIISFASSCLLASTSWIPFIEYLGYSEIGNLRKAEIIWPTEISKIFVVGAFISGLIICLISIYLLINKKGVFIFISPLCFGVGLLILNTTHFGGDGQILNFILPDAFGRMYLGTWHAPTFPNSVEVNADYTGVLPFIILILSPIFIKGKSKSLWAVYFITILSWVYSSRTPFVYQLGRSIFPIAQATRSSVLIPLGVAFLSSHVLSFIIEALNNNYELKKYTLKLMIGITTSIVVCIILWGMGIWKGFSWPKLDPRDLAFFILTLTFIFILLTKPKKIFIPLACALIFADLYTFGKDFNTVTPLKEAYPETNGISWLKNKAKEAQEKGKPFRVIGDKWTMRPNTLCVYGLSDARGHDCFDPSRYVMLLYSICKNLKLPQDVGIDTLMLESRVFDILGVRYLCTDKKWDCPKNWKLAYYGKDMNIYENVDYLSRAYLAKNGLLIYNAFNKKNGILHFKKGIDPRYTVLLEKNIKLPEKSYENGFAKIIEDTPNKIKIKTTADGYSWLVLLDNYLPGWKAKLDGKKELKIYRAFSAFRAVILPPGEHVVEFTYFPTGFKIGIYLTILGFVCLFLTLVPFSFFKYKK